MTRAQLQAAAEKAGVKFEFNPWYGDKDYYNCMTHEFERLQMGWYFGINNLSGRDSWNWTWFKSVGMDEDWFWFEERYSMRTGKSNKGWRECYKAHERIANLLGITQEELFNVNA